MNYTIDQLNKFMDKLQASEKEIRIDRGKRYGSPDDTLANVREFGADGCIISMWECVMRIRRNFCKPKDVADSRNAVQDLRNFAAYFLKFVEEESAPLNVCSCEHNKVEIKPWKNESQVDIMDMPALEDEWDKQPTKEIDDDSHITTD